ncbi:unnamed protein product [Urochloa decumbens]|uniref:Pectinesterase inhibitor domain-containing protein n=1 Tax=Urochloa decumbens TaxID=240449 RepID=A0ABC9FH81_9POAL
MVAATTTSSMVVLLGIMAAFLAATVAHGSVDVEHQGKPQYKTGDLVANSCANVRPYDWTPLLPRRMCESTLRSDKHSATAKTELDLVLVAMDLLQSAAAKVDGVLRNNYSGSGRHGKSTALAVQYCRLDYAAVARTVPMCRAMVQEYNPEHPNLGNDYYDCVARLGNAAANCWGYVLVDNELAKAVSKEVGEVFQRATLVRAMIEVMIGFPDSNN